MTDSPNESRTIDVLIAVDTDTILQQYPGATDPNNPVQVTSNPPPIFMIAKQGDVVSGEAGNELNLVAEVMDTVRWRETTLTLNADYTTILYKFVATGGDQLISPPVPLLATVNTPLPNPADPLHPTSQTIKSYFWNTTVLDVGSVTYHFSFMILDRNGNPKGYYWWDPFITIKN
jgi:hypothetical protein